MYHTQTVQHKSPCFNLFKLHNNSLDNQGSEINKNNIFYSFPQTVFYKNFLSTLLYILYFILYVYI